MQNFYKLFLDLSEFHTVKIYIEGKMKYYNAFSEMLYCTFMKLSFKYFEYSCKDILQI